MIDLLGHLVGHPRTEHSLTLLAPGAAGGLPLGDNFALNCRYSDGSVTTLTYTSLGHPAPGKERLECYWDGRAAILDDYRRLELHGASGSTAPREFPDKGHAEILRRFVEHARGRGPVPIALDEILDVSHLVLTLDAQARGATSNAQDR